ncbi:MAG: HAMP domain-containing protein, partial [Rhizobiaceae bacterium]|nr:HAMP domain-containing protein [Rhizobiaceae bacterium]
MDIGVLAGRIQSIAQNYEAAAATARQDKVLAAAGGLGLQVTRLPPERLIGSAISNADVPLAVRSLLDNDPIQNPAVVLHQTGAKTLVVAAGDNDFLEFVLPPALPAHGMFYPIVTALAFVVIPAPLLAFVCAWIIARPLVRFAAAAERVSMDDELEEPFRTEGAAEIRSLAASLNTMRRRVLDLMGQRTRMLTSISHDLRTPLTRLRMRTERCEQPELRGLLLKDIEMLALMIDDNLAYLSNALEARRKVELSSLLQTIADDFADTGVNINF